MRPAAVDQALRPAFSAPVLTASFGPRQHRSQDEHVAKNSDPEEAGGESRGETLNEHDTLQCVLCTARWSREGTKRFASSRSSQEAAQSPIDGRSEARPRTTGGA